MCGSLVRKTLWWSLSFIALDPSAPTTFPLSSGGVGGYSVQSVLCRSQVVVLFSEQLQVMQSCATLDSSNSGSEAASFAVLCGSLCVDAACTPCSHQFRFSVAILRCSGCDSRAAACLPLVERPCRLRLVHTLQQARPLASACPLCSRAIHWCCCTPFTL